MIVGVAPVYLLVLPSFADAILRFVLDTIDNVRLGSLYAALAIMFMPVMLLGVYSPFAIRLVLRATQRSGSKKDPLFGVIGVAVAGAPVGFETQPIKKLLPANRKGVAAARPCKPESA
jgi:hypothetical protein